MDAFPSFNTAKTCLSQLYTHTILQMLDVKGQLLKLAHGIVLTYITHL